MGVLTIYQQQGEGATVAAGTALSAANLGANRYTGGQLSLGTGATGTFATPPAPPAGVTAPAAAPGQPLYAKITANNVVAIARQMADTPSKSMTYYVWVMTPDVPPTTLGTADYMYAGRQATGNPQFRIVYDYLGNISLRDAGEVAANDIVLATGQPLGVLRLVQVIATAGTATVAPYDGQITADIYDTTLARITAGGVSKTSTTWNLGTNPFVGGDGGLVKAVAQTRNGGFGAVKMENDRATYIGELLVNTAAGGTSGTQVTTAAQTAGKSGAALDPVTYASTGTIWFDSAHPRVAGGMGYRINVADGGSGQLAIPLGTSGVGVQSARGAVTAYVDDIPPTSERIFTIHNTAGGRVAYVYITSTGKVRFDNSSAQLGISTLAVSVGDQLTIEWVFTAGSTTTGTLMLRAYRRNDLTGTNLIYEKVYSPTATRTDGTAADGTGTDTGIYNADAILLGRGVAIAGAASHYWSDLRWAPNEAGGYLGPAAGGITANDAVIAAPAAVATADAPAPVVAGVTLVTGGGPATASGQFRTPAVSGGAIVRPPAAAALALAITPVVAGGNATVIAAPAATATATAPAPTVLAATSALLDAPAATATAAGRVPSVSGGARVLAVAATVLAAATVPQVTADASLTTRAASASASAPAPSLSVDALIAPPAATALAEAPAPIAYTAVSGTVIAPRAGATATARPPIVSASAALVAARATATAGALPPTVLGGSAGLITAPAATGTGTGRAPVVTAGARVAVAASTATSAALAPSVSATAILAAPTASAQASAPAPTVSTSENVLIEAPAATAVAQAPAPEVATGRAAGRDITIRAWLTPDRFKASLNTGGSVFPRFYRDSPEFIEQTVEEVTRTANTAIRQDAVEVYFSTSNQHPVGDVWRPADQIDRPDDWTAVVKYRIDARVMSPGRRFPWVRVVDDEEQPPRCTSLTGVRIY